jgi:hypothetical protein
MAVFMQRVSVSSATYGAAQVAIPFKPKRVAVINESTSNAAFASFDGVNDHGKLVPGTPAAGLTYEQALGLTDPVTKTIVSNVWLRHDGSTVTVQVIAEG